MGSANCLHPQPVSGFRKERLRDCHSAHRIGPACVERQVRDRFDQFPLVDSIFYRSPEMKSQLVWTIECNERSHGYKTIETALSSRAVNRFA